MAPGDKAPGLPHGRLYGQQLLVGYMKTTLLAARGEGQVGEGGEGGDSPPTDSNKQLIKRKWR